MNAPIPEINDLNRPYWQGLAEGELRFQHCLACGENWLPARNACPRCLARAFRWQASEGMATVVSWVVYHKAYAPYLAARIPYEVSIVALNEGPRLVTNIVDSEAGKKLRVGLRVGLAIGQEAGVAVARFRISDGENND
ncbi:MAG: hypothetical protein JWO15_3058 [Sphingomonadales bacterium]|nr:hypothetical protein [Sphingomonadales bacterium]